jgi:hypothetical protein
LPADARTYDLEWYPYGSLPMKEGLPEQRAHHGLDFPNLRGTAILAAGAGVVVQAGYLPGDGDGYDYYGNTVIIRHDWLWQGQEVYSLYAHAEKLFVRKGDRVAQGQVIAGVGASGNTSGPHLHFEVRVGANTYSDTRNPALWIAPYEGWGNLAGRFVDVGGQLIHGALVRVRPAPVDGLPLPEPREQRTYGPGGPNPDDVWGENFVVADLPAGLYAVEVRTGESVFRRQVEVRPGMTNFFVIQAGYYWSPTPTPTPTPSPSASPTAGS